MLICYILRQICFDYSNIFTMFPTSYLALMFRLWIHEDRMKTLPRLKTDPDWFKQLFARNGVSLNDVARKTKMNNASLSRSINGKRRFQTTELAALSELLGEPMDTILAHAGVTLKRSVDSRSIRLDGALDENLSMTVEGLRGARTVPCPVAGKNVRAVRCQTAGGKYESMDGAIVYFQPSEKFDIRHLGRPCLVRIAGVKEVKFRVPRRGYTANRTNLTTLWGEVLEGDVVVESASPVLEIVF